MAVFKCKMCGGALEVNNGESVAVCDYCGTKQTLPKTDDGVVANLFHRANNLRLKCEFDKAEAIYEKILEQDNTEAEAHWGIILCKYGIEYVEDPKTFERIPTCHRTSYESITASAEYLAALEHADSMQKEVYEHEAKAIDSIQKNILSIVKNEKPFDVFICYNETDENGKRTVVSAIAYDIYYQLTQEGFKVFYAAITLEDKLGQEYEPYIFAALNSAKVMLAIGTKPEYFEAVWVKNEWSRFMNLMKTDRSKLLIPCYKDMDAYDLPEDFAHLQAQDMGKIGFINDVVRGIKKVIVKDEAKETLAKGEDITTESTYYINSDTISFKVSAGEVKQNYNILVNQVDNATATVTNESGTEIAAAENGQKVIVSVEMLPGVDESITIKGILVRTTSGSQVSATAVAGETNKWSFTMPMSAVTINIDLNDPNKYVGHPALGKYVGYNIYSRNSSDIDFSTSTVNKLRYEITSAGKFIQNESTSTDVSYIDSTERGILTVGSRTWSYGGGVIAAPYSDSKGDSYIAVRIPDGYTMDDLFVKVLYLSSPLVYAVEFHFGGQFSTGLFVADDTYYCGVTFSYDGDMDRVGSEGTFHVHLDDTIIYDVTNGVASVHA